LQNKPKNVSLQFKKEINLTKGSFMLCWILLPVLKQNLLPPNYKD